MVLRIAQKVGVWTVFSLFFLTGKISAQDLNAQASNLCSVAAGTFITGQYKVQQVLGQQALQIAQQQTGGTGVYSQLQPYGQPAGLFVTNPHYDQDQTQGQLFHFYCTTQHNSGLLQWELKYSASSNKIVYYSFAPAQQQQQNPTNPQVPTNPQNPSNPQFPTNPQNPQFPTNPQNPSNPQFPTNPQNPSNPQFPTNPQNPSNPQFPTNPQNPSNPQFPTNPQNPSNPQLPTNPQNPQQPVSPSKEDACKMFPGMC